VHDGGEVAQDCRVVLEEPVDVLSDQRLRMIDLPNDLVQLLNTLTFRLDRAFSMAACPGGLGTKLLYASRSAQAVATAASCSSSFIAAATTESLSHSMWVEMKSRM